MKKIPLTRGKFASVDEEDFDEMSKYRWHYTHGYARRTAVHDGKKYQIYMHREVARAPSCICVDHINMDSLDNRKSNLRWATKSQNGMNRNLNKNNTHGAKGIVFHKGRRSPWSASIKVNRKVLYLGYFETKELAIDARLAGEKKFFGEFSP